MTSAFATEEASSFRVLLDSASIALKQRMLRCHVSQRTLLKLFPVEMECFRLASSYDFASKPGGAEPLYDDHDLGMTSGHWREIASQCIQAMGFPKFL